MTFNHDAVTLLQSPHMTIELSSRHFMVFKFSKQAPRKLVAIIALCCSVAACVGGGGTTRGNPTEQVAALPTPVTAVATAMTTSTATPSFVNRQTADNFSCGLNGAAGIQAEVLQRINTLRASGAICGTTGYAATGAVAWNAKLLQAASGHSADMAQKNYFAHNGLDGRTSAQRVTAAGYNWSIVAENIAAGQTSVERVMTGWAKSPGHCQNLMNPNFRDVAVACVRNDAADYRQYWTMAMGRSR